MSRWPGASGAADLVEQGGSLLRQAPVVSGDQGSQLGGELLSLGELAAATGDRHDRPLQVIAGVAVDRDDELLHPPPQLGRRGEEVIDQLLFVVDL